MNKLTRTPNLTELTYRSIKHTVLMGDVARTFRLTEEYLANHLGISKSPVREALNRLEAEGFIRIEARRGAYVRQFSAKEILDLYNLRALLEVHSIGAATISPALLAELAASITRTEAILSKGDRYKHIEEDLHFHSIIAEATGNDELCRTFENVQQKSVLCRYKSFELSASISPLAHRKIYQALLLDDRKEAQKSMEEHIFYVRDRLLARVEEQSTPSSTLTRQTTLLSPPLQAPKNVTARRSRSTSRPPSELQRPTERAPKSPLVEAD